MTNLELFSERRVFDTGKVRSQVKSSKSQRGQSLVRSTAKQKPEYIHHHIKLAGGVKGVLSPRWRVPLQKHCRESTSVRR